MSSITSNKQYTLLKLFLTLAALGGVLALIFLFSAPSMERNAWFLGYSMPRILLGAFTALLLGLILILSIMVFRGHNIRMRFAAWLDQKANNSHWLLSSTLVFSLIFLSGAALLFLRYSGGTFFSSLLSPRLDDLISTLIAILTRAEPLLIWGLSLIVLSFLFLVILFKSAYLEPGFLNRKRIYRTLLIYIMIPVTGFHWLILYFQLYVFIAIPHWFWKFYIKPSQNDQLFLFLLLISLAITAFIWLKPRRIRLNLALVILLGYILQVGFGFIQGEGFGSLRRNFIETGHHGYAQYACKEPHLLEFIRDYENIAQHDSFFMTKPPGVVSFYIVLQNLLDGISPLDSSDARYAQLTTFMSITFPLLAALTLLPLFHLSKEFVNHEDAVLPGILFISIPAVILTPLYLDQELYPLFFTIGILGIIKTISSNSIKWAIGTGAVIYFMLFFSFSLLPLIPLAAAWLWMDYFLNRKCKNFKKTMMISFGMAAGFLLGYLLFMLILNYDMLLRYTNALAQHRLHKEYLIGFRQIRDAIILNNVELAAWLGFPFVLLLLGRLLRFAIAFLKHRWNKMDVLIAAFILTYVALNIFGQTRSEVARLWIFLMPLLSLFTADETIFLFNRSDPSKKSWNLAGFLLIISLQLITIFLTFKFQDLD